MAKKNLINQEEFEETFKFKVVKLDAHTTKYNGIYQMNLTYYLLYALVLLYI